MISAGFDLRAPESVPEALELLAKYREDARVLAGGHELVPALRVRAVTPLVLVDLRRVPGLDAIEENEAGGLRLGARVTQREAAAAALVQSRAWILAETARQANNAGSSLAGAICGAGAAADCPAALLALGAMVAVASPRGERLTPLADFIQGPHETALEPDELVTGIELSRSWPRTAAYVKVAPHPGGAPWAGVAAQLVLEGGVVAAAAAGVTGAGERVFLAAAVSRLTGHVASPERIAAAAGDICSGQSVAASSGAGAEYRSHLACVCARRALALAASRGEEA